MGKAELFGILLPVKILEFVNMSSVFKNAPKYKI